MKRIIWWIKHAVRAVGWPGAVGIALLVAAVGLYGVVLTERSAKLATLKKEGASLRERIDRAAKSGIPVSSSADELQKFYGFFATGGATDWLDKLYAAADTAGLTLDQGEYRTVPDKTGKLIRYQVTLPVKGSYGQIRRFVDLALVEVPIASLDDISFKREAIGATQLEARVKLTLFLRVN